MKKLIVTIVFAIMTFSFVGCSSSNYLGTEHNDRRMVILEKEIKDIKEKIEYLKFSADSVGTDAKLSSLTEKLVRLQAQRDSLIWRFISDEKIPRELSPGELKARLRANIVRRQEMVLGKIESGLLTDTDGQQRGLKVIVANDYWRDITFKINPTNGGERVSVNVVPGKQDEIFLIPGNYIVSYFVGGQEVGQPQPLTIDGAKHKYRNQDCFGFVYMPGRR